MKVPFVDFISPSRELKADLDETYFRFMVSAWYVFGRRSRLSEPNTPPTAGRSNASALETAWMPCIWCCGLGTLATGMK